VFLYTLEVVLECASLPALRKLDDGASLAKVVLFDTHRSKASGTIFSLTILVLLRFAGGLVSMLGPGASPAKVLDAVLDGAIPAPCNFCLVEQSAAPSGDSSTEVMHRGRGVSSLSFRSELCLSSHLDKGWKLKLVTSA
jgi:hypothetical protein